MKTNANRTKKAVVTFIAIAIVFFLNASVIFDVNAQLEPGAFVEPVYKQAEKSVEVMIHKKDAIYTVRSLEITTFRRPYLDSFDSYKGKSWNGSVMSFQGSALGYFGLDDMVITVCSDRFGKDGSISGGCEDVPEGDFKIMIPWFPNGKYSEIYSPDGKRILTIDLSSKAVCNENGKCNRPVEDSVNCSRDCKDRQPIVDTPVTSGGQISPQQTAWEKVKPYVVIAIAALALIGAVAYAIAHIRRKNEY